MVDEINKLQEERGKLYGDFSVHCQNVAERLKVSPEMIGFFYIHSKIVRWINCPTKENRDSVIDCISYIDLMEKHFGPTLSKSELRFLNKTKTDCEIILERL